MKILYRNLAVPLTLAVIALLTIQLMQGIREIPIGVGFVLAFALFRYVWDDMKRMGNDARS